MLPPHKNKTLTTFMAAIFGGVGLHRFYLRGMKDFAGWAHFLTLPLTLLGAFCWRAQPTLFVAMPLLISALIGLVEALVIGLTADEKWDATYNSNSGQLSNSGWPLAVLLVLTFALGAIAVIAAIARSFDLLFTGGAYG